MSKSHLSDRPLEPGTHASRCTFSDFIACIILATSVLHTGVANSTTHTIINLGELTALALGYDQPNWGRAYDINEAGQIVGMWQDNAFFYDPVTGMNGRPIPDTINNSFFSGLNDSGRSVGWISGNIFYSRVTYNPVTDTYTEVPGGSASSYADIDNSGTILERSFDEMVADYAGPTDLFALLPANPGWDSLTPVAMNSAGQIVGWGYLSNDPIPDFYPFLMNPIPLPPALWLFGSGLLGLIGIARRRKFV